MSTAARFGVIGLMVLAICVARLVEVELAAPRLHVQVVRPAEEQAEATAEASSTPAPAASAPEVAAAPSAAPAERTYTVQSGDTLGKISKTVYGTTRYWKLILDANPDAIPNPKRVKLGATLRIPPRPVSESK